MDPQATWNALLDAYARDDWEEVEDLAQALLGWLEGGGFPPTTAAAGAHDVNHDREFVVQFCRQATKRANESRDSSTHQDDAESSP